MMSRTSTTANANATRAAAPVGRVRVASSCIDVVDPVARAVLSVPEQHLLPTRGLDEYRAAPGTRDISLCCLFQKSRCRAQNTCRQVHADRAFVSALRTAQTETVRCCGACAAPPTPKAGGTVVLTGRATTGMPPLPTNRIVPTYGCRDPATLTTLEWSNMCRLQLQDTCKYGDSCRNVHVCTKIGKMLLARAAVTVNAVVPDSVRATAAGLEAAIAGPAAAPAIVAPVAESAKETAPAPVAAALLGIAPVARCVDAEVVEVRTAAKATKRTVPLALRAKFPSLDEASLTLHDGDLDGLIFNLPTLASTSDAGTDRFDLFSPSPAARCVCSPSMASPHFA